MNISTSIRRRRVLVFDSGLGGLTVFARIAEARSDVELVYAADDAYFPYGALSEAALVERVGAVMDDLIARTSPDVVVIACSTASTLVLPPLRAAYPQLPFVGTVPAIKPAATASKSRMISVLATPGTVARDYTRGLVREFAAGCQVTLVGAPHLAGLAERALRGEPVADADVAREIAACFVAQPGRRTDQVVLACTHFPLLLSHFERLAPWPVAFVDPAPAIARRVDSLIGAGGPTGDAGRPFAAFFTSGRPPSETLRKALRRLGLTATSAAKRAAAD
jgi:glutamate racemase